MLDLKWVVCGVYVIFMMFNIFGVGIVVIFELIVILLVIFELLVFMGVVVFGFFWSYFIINGWVGVDSFSGLVLLGMFVVILFVIWFFFVIEGVFMVVEEVKDL